MNVIINDVNVLCKPVKYSSKRNPVKELVKRGKEKTRDHILMYSSS